MLNFIIKGGVFMYPIILCSILSFAIFLEKLWSLRRKKNIPNVFLNEVEQLLNKNNFSEALKVCENNHSSISRIFSIGIKNYGKKREVIKERIEEVGRREASVLGKYLEALETVASTSTPGGNSGRNGKRKDPEDQISSGSSVPRVGIEPADLRLVISQEHAHHRFW